MPDSRFFKPEKGISLKRLAEIADCRLADGVNPDFMINNVASLQSGKEDEIAFFDNKKMQDIFKNSQVKACIVKDDFKNDAFGKFLLFSAKPQSSFVAVANYFYPQKSKMGISEQAVVSKQAKLGQNCLVEAGVVIEDGVVIGDNCVIGSASVIRQNVSIGNDCIVDANVTISHAVIGNRVTIYPGVRIGQDGFGYIMSERGHTKIPQLGKVVIGDDVDIGANSTIDRGALDDTVIGNGSKIDNLVQIAHNVKLGFGCVSASQAGISGSTELGNLVAIGGQVGIAGHLRLGDGANVAAKSGVMRDVGSKETVMGYPAFPMREFMRQIAYLQKVCRSK
ncbi:MAG: UDP-3-O-(3-hydroxymyristoyl)glucosamine N-acyltransferase [Alphaproteobacteria bacterium]